MSTLRIFCFGGLRLLRGEAPLPPFPTHKTRSLFAYLATYRQRPHPRPVLAGTFWGDMPDARAHRNLNTTLWRLRRVLESPPIPPQTYLLVEEDYLQFNLQADYWLDVGQFEEQVHKATARRDSVDAFVVDSLTQAVALYRGPFLDGFYDDWCLLERERLRDLYLEALLALMTYHKEQSRYEEALLWAQRLVHSDPLREEAHRELMQLYHLLGRRSTALQQYEWCRQLLQDELGVEPMAETTALLDEISRSAEAPVRYEPASPYLPLAARPLPRTPFDDFGQVPLVGREEELGGLLSLVEAAAVGQGGMVLIEGEAGVGKTRLVQEMARGAERQGARVLRGECHELVQAPPFQVLTEALRSGLPDLTGSVSPVWLSPMTSLLPELTQMVPGLAPPDPLPPDQERGRLLEALAQCMLGLGEAGPLVIVLEDLHWMDPSTGEALRYLVPRLRQARVLLVGTIRPEEVDQTSSHAEVIRSLDGSGLLRRLALGRLSPVLVGQLMRQVLGLEREAPIFTQRIYQESEGNPFFIAEVLKGSYEEGLLYRDDQGDWSTPWDEVTADYAELPVTRGIRQVVERRLIRLEKGARATLDLAAVLGRAFDFDLLWRATGRSEEEVLETTDDLLRRQLLVEQEDKLRFTHDKIRQVAYEGLSQVRRRMLHRQSGLALEDLASDRVEELANHFHLARDHRRALGYCLQAGDRARAIYAQAALTYYGWAIEAAQQVGGAAARQALIEAHGHRGQVWEHLGNYTQALADYEAMRAAAEAAGNAGQVASAVRRCGWIRGSNLGDLELGLREARRAHELALAAGDSREAAAALRDMAAYHNMRGEYAAALEAHQAALASFRALGDAAGEATSLHYIAVTHLFLSQHTEALNAFHQALAIWERLGDRRAVAKMWCNIGQVQINQGEFAAAEEALRRAEVGFRAIAATPALFLVLIGLAALHGYRGRCQECLKALEEARAIEETSGQSAYNCALILFHRGWARWAMGELGAGLADLREALTLARQAGTPTLVAGLHNALGCYCRQLGDAEQAMVHHQEGLALARQVAFAGGEAEALTGLGLDQLALGQVEGALSCLQAAWDLARGLGQRSELEALLGLSEAWLADGDPVQAHSLATEALALAEAMDLRASRVQCHHLLGRSLAMVQQPDQAEAELRRALQLADPPGYPLLRWPILVALGYMLDGQGRRAEAKALRDGARSIVEEAVKSLGDERLCACLRALAGAELVKSRNISSKPRDALEGGQVRLALARIGAPLGRPLREDEKVAVVWTVDAGPEDEALRQREGKVALRRARILRLLAEAQAQGGDPTEADLAQALGVTPRTVRSDVAALRRAGHRVRTRGSRISS